jgi:hypothetical protein
MAAGRLAAREEVEGLAGLRRATQGKSRPKRATPWAAPKKIQIQISMVSAAVLKDTASAMS